MRLLSLARCGSGVPGGIRTPDLPLRRGLLYPAELPRRAEPVQYIRIHTGNPDGYNGLKRS